MIELKKMAMVALLVTDIMFTEASQAALFDRGNGLLYDDVLNVTWLQDANYAKTSGFSTTGLMDWTTATTWAANLNYNGLTGWRLPNISPINGINYNFNVFNPTNDGSSDIGFNITSPNSELSYMYYVNLGLKGYLDANGSYQPNFGIFGNGTYNGYNQSSLGQNNVELIKNLQANVYWSGSEMACGTDGTDKSCAWDFVMDGGWQTRYDKFATYTAWAVHPGDVAPVPIPGAVWLFTSGLGLLSFVRRQNS